MGLFIASTSLGYAFSLFLSGLALKLGGIALCFWLTGLGPALGALLAYKVLWAAPAGGGRRKAPAGTFSRKVLKNRPAMYLIAGYSLHNYELLGMWAWTPAFLAACLAVGGTGEGQAVSLGSSLAGVFHLLGLLASLTVGALSDRLGRGRVLTATAAAGAFCSLSFGFTMGLSLWLVMLLGMVYAFVSLGDSPVLSAGLSEAVDPACLGGALGLRSLVGFGAGALSPLVFGLVLDATGGGGGRLGPAMGPGFASLGLGGLGAIWAARRYQRLALDSPSH